MIKYRLCVTSLVFTILLFGLAAMAHATTYDGSSFWGTYESSEGYTVTFGGDESLVGYDVDSMSGYLYIPATIDDSWTADVTGTVYTFDYTGTYTGTMVDAYSFDLTAAITVAYYYLGTYLINAPVSAEALLEWASDYSSFTVSGISYTSVVLPDGTPADITFTRTATPIPGAVWLLGSGLMGLVGLRRRLSGRA